MQKTNISWATHIWNPITGCSPCSPGCANCYARDLHDKRHKAFLEGKKVPACYAKPFNEITLFQERMKEPYSLRNPSIVFAGSMTDVFHPDVSADWIYDMLGTITNCPKHTFMMLTKRPKWMHELMREENMKRSRMDVWPNSNLWLGVTVCNQDEYKKISHLTATPAAHRFISYEPALGPLKIKPKDLEKLDFVICGGETGENARPLHPDWVRSLRDQCKTANVPFHFKQWGEWEPCKWDNRNNEGYWHDPTKKLVFVDKNDGTFSQNHLKPIPDEWPTQRVGFKRAGHLLDGVEYRAMPGEKS